MRMSPEAPTLMGAMNMASLNVSQRDRRLGRRHGDRCRVGALFLDLDGIRIDGSRLGAICHCLSRSACG